MTPIDIIEWCSARRIKLSTDGDRLFVEAPHGVLTDAITARLKARKEELIPLLVNDKWATCPAVDRPCRAAATYPDREGIWCAHDAVFRQKAGRPVQVRKGATCPLTTKE